MLLLRLPRRLHFGEKVPESPLHAGPLGLLARLLRIVDLASLRLLWQLRMLRLALLLPLLHLRGLPRGALLRGLRALGRGRSRRLMFPRPRQEGRPGRHEGHGGPVLGGGDSGRASPRRLDPRPRAQARCSSGDSHSRRCESVPHVWPRNLLQGCLVSGLP